MKKSISKKSIIIRAMATIAAMALTTTACILLTFFRVQTDIVKSNVDNLFAAVESGPLEFAHLHSAVVAGQQLEKLMKSLVNLDLGYQLVKISGGDNFADVFAEWHSQNLKESESDKCNYKASKTYSNPAYLYPFRVEISVDVCEGFPLIKSLQYSILGILSLSFLILSLSPLSILAPLGSSITAMENIIRKKLGPEKIDSVRYEPLRDVVKLAMQVQESEREAAVGRIISQLSHDLRAPVATFERLLYAEPQITVESQKESIRESLLRLHSMIESLRYSDRESLIERNPVHFVFDRALSGLLFKAQGKGISINLPSVEEIFARIDEKKVERAWCNLVSNAMDFASSTIWLEVEAQEMNLILRVIDDGPGVANEFLPRLFQRGATHGKSDGTGLGLAYVRQIMRGHGGDVSYRRENDLTIFECRLPNAIELEKDQTVENVTSFEIQAVQKLVRVVSICLDPPALSESVRSKLASHNSDEFFFIGEREGAHIVVSNIDDVMFEVVEADEQEFISVSQLKGDENRIIEILKRKFNLV